MSSPVPPQQREFLFTIALIFAGVFFFSMSYVFVSGILVLFGELDVALHLSVSIFITMVFLIPLLNK